MAEKERGMALAGFVVFAAVLLLTIGMIHMVQGFVALVDDERLGLTADKLVIVDVTAWGWTLIVSGLLLMAVGGGLLAAAGWARIAAIVAVCLHAVTQTAWLGAYPVWSLLMIALDVVVLYALTARWSDVRDRLGGVGEAPWSGMEEARLSAAERHIPPVV
ncbi:DUF7144 family membrane protein [Kribbella shirazensis]|uniref:Vacuolar-type H+-ATPase subunit I/STV1 n=1 Tax=Kribbella shirazensis TaxID=1105143 RepID=A0A7X5VE24_9ACTN|nr:hypothetical protein [Kribbella shirazensis]NIK59294.1 vacuolar-type H+-ATPase subunit I/STV1 [Kribbella shirazensis]